MLCAIARLDEEATRKLISLQKTAFGDAVCLKPLYGHITIAAYTGTEEARFIRSCRESLAGFSAFTVTYSKIEVLEETSIIVATPVKTGSLKEIHQIIAKQFEDSLDEWTKQKVPNRNHKAERTQLQKIQQKGSAKDKLM